MFQTAQLVVAAAGAGQDRTMICPVAGRVVLAVTDGAAGRAGGAEASQGAIDFLRRQAAAARDARDCVRLLTELDSLLAKDPVAGETTAVLAIVEDGGVFGASVGDSGAWTISRNGIIDDLTRDQVRKPCLGVGCARPVAFSRQSLDGTLLLATDGLLKYTSRDRIEAASISPEFETLAERLVALVRLPSGAVPDDVGVVVCRRLQS